MKRLTTRAWIVLTAAFLCVCVLLSLWSGRRKRGQIAAVYVDGVCIRRVDLARVTRSERWTVETDSGFNVVLLEPGRIRVETADCPDQICVSQGWLPDSPLPIVCLPHGLIIQLEEASP